MQDGKYINNKLPFAVRKSVKVPLRIYAVVCICNIEDKQASQETSNDSRNVFFLSKIKKNIIHESKQYDCPSKSR